MTLSAKARKVLPIGLADRAVGKEVADAIDAAGVGLVSLAATIVNGDVTHAPDGNSVFDALALKADASALTAKQDVITMDVATTLTAGSVGQVPVAGMTIAGKVLVSCAEDPGAGLVFSDAICGAGFFTVWTKDTVAVPGARAELSGKKVAYLVISL